MMYCRLLACLVMWCTAVVSLDGAEPYFEKSALFEGQTDGFGRPNVLMIELAR